MKRLTGAQAMVRVLQDLGVKTVFGHPGGAILPFYDALYESGLEHILMRHEQAAAHAAQGYARVTGKPGVCIATSGPGATNLVTGLTDAFMDSTPVVAITGQVPSHLLGTDAFQEADVFRMTLPATKHSYQVLDPRELPRVLAEAFAVASTGRPGPVLVDVPKDVQLGMLDYTAEPYSDLRVKGGADRWNGRDLSAAARLLSEARRPVAICGGGVVSGGASRLFTAFARKGNFPVVCTSQGLGGFPASDPQYLGFVGMHGTQTANRAVSQCDLLIAVGMRFDDRVTGKIEKFAPRAKILHLDIDPSEIGKVLPAAISMVGDAKRSLRALLPFVPGVEYAEWWGLLRSWQKQYPLRYASSTDGVTPEYLLETLGEVTGGEGTVAVDVGQHQMWACQYVPFEKPRLFVNSGGLGTMGFGFPAAIGAQLASGGPVVCVSGDGSFQMNLQELTTLARLKAPVKILLMDNSSLGMVRQWQDFFFRKRFSASDMTDNPDFVRVAEAFGIRGRRLEHDDDVEKTLREVLASKGPELVHVKIGRDEKVLPMVPPNTANCEMVDETPERAPRIQRVRRRDPEEVHV